MRLLASLACVSVASTAQAQCQPHWEAFGGIGLTSSGYAAPMFVMNLGSGDQLYVGGSFSSVGGYSTPGIARWDPAASAWSAVGTGCYTTSTNYFLAALGSFDFGTGPELVAGGSFSTAGGSAASANLGRWNGTRWAAVPGGGPPSGAVWAIANFQSRLFIGGGFTTVGNAAANGVASFDAETGWLPVGSGLGGGYSPVVFALSVHNDGTGSKLYAGGRCTSLGGVSGMIARWTGAAWEPIGGGVTQGSTFADIESMAVFNDGTGNALYVGGYDLLPFQGSLCSVAKWDGSHWTSVGQYLGGRTTSLAVFDDGTGPALYAGGTAQPGVNYIGKLVGGQWVTLSGGVSAGSTPPFPSVFGLMAWNDQLVVGGEFDHAGSAGANGLAAWRACTGPGHCSADFNHDGDVATDADIEDFFRCIAGNCCATCDSPDFNGDGDTATDADIESFFRVIAGGNC